MKKECVEDVTLRNFNSRLSDVATNSYCILVGDENGNKKMIKLYAEEEYK